MIGAGLGLVNGLLIGGLGLPTLIVTLGTLGFFRGALLTFLGTSYIVNLPSQIDDFSNRNLIVLTNAAGQTASLPVSFLILVVVVLLVWLLMNWTMMGRNIYAIGGTRRARAGSASISSGSRFWSMSWPARLQGSPESPTSVSLEPPTLSTSWGPS